MTRRLSVFFILWVAFALHVVAAELPRAEPEDVGLSSDKLAALDAHFQAYVDDGRLAGLTTLIARRGKIAHFQTYGAAEMATSRAMSDDAIFRIYSMTKPITSTAIMMLVEEGKIALEDPVSKYIPAFADVRVFKGTAEDGSVITEPAAREITVIDLMRHTAGLTYGVFGDTPVDKQYRESGLLDPNQNVEAWIAKLAARPLLYQPGKAWVYSFAVDVQGHLVELVSAKSLDQFFEDRIFSPLGMVDTAFYADEARAPRLVEIYGRDKEKGLVPVRDQFSPDFTVKPTMFSGGGGLVSTTADYWRFSQMILNGGELDGVRLLEAETVKAMLSDQLPEGVNGIAGGKQGTGFGLGFAVVTDPAKQGNGTRKGEANWGGLANTVFWVDPKEEIVAVLMTNILPARAYPLRAEFRKHVYDAVVE